MTQESGNRPIAEQQVKQTFAALAIGSLLAAVAVYLLRETLGIPDETARLVSLAFALLAVVDGLVIYFWDRIFKRSK